MPAGQHRFGIRQQGLSMWRALERGFDAAFGAACNPLRHLGAIGFLAIWLLLASGVLLYAVYDTSVAGAWRSVTALETWPLASGRLLRGVHRYATDVLVVVIALHIVREWLHRHERGVRRFHWLTGVPTVAFAAISAVGGFWLAWDRLGQYSALASAEWLDAVPLLGAPFARNFLALDAVSDRLFSLFIFIHIGVSLLLLFGLWFHLQRLSRAAVMPPRSLALGVSLLLLVLALVAPVLSQPPATALTEPVALDWFVLWLHPLTDASTRGVTWALVAGAMALLVLAPFLPQPARPAVAVVDPANCSGCERCFDDCPYAAITMVPHPQPRVGRLLAQVDPDLCVACGICAGACPSSTPFRGVETLVSGIDMPQLTVDALRRRLRQDVATSTAREPLVIFTCDHGASASAALSEDTSVLGLICAGQLPPSFIEYALRDGAAGVVVATCRDGGCEFRLGERWTAERLAGLREPRLRARMPRERLERVQAGPGDEAALVAAVARLRERVRTLSIPSN